MTGLGKRIAGPFDPRVLGVFAVALYLPVIVGVGGVDIRQFLVVALIVLLAVSYGHFVVRLLDIHKLNLPLDPLRFVIGFISMSLLILIFTELLNIGALVSAFLCAVGVVLLAAFKRRITSDIHEIVGEIVSRPIDVLLVMVVSVIVCIWSREALNSVRMAQDTGIFRAWSDFFLFASEIRYQELFPSFRGESMYLSGVPQVFYHRASFSMAGLFSGASASPPLETAMYFWMPTGIILFGISTYLFGFALAGRGAGVISVVALFLTPDPAMYWKNDPLFSFHWLIQVAPGTGYALSSVLIGFSFLVVGIKNEQFRISAIGACFVIAAAAFRVQIAIPATLCFGLVILFAWPIRQKWYRAIGMLIVVFLAISLIYLFEHIPLAPHFISGKLDGLKYIEIILGVLPFGYAEIRQMWEGVENIFAKSLMGYLAIVPLELGIFLPLLIISLMVASCRSILDRLWIIPVSIIVVHGGITVFMPTPAHGDISDWTHRSFPLLYTIVVVYVAVCMYLLLTRFVNISYFERLPSLKKMILLLCALCLTYFPWYYGEKIQRGFIGDGMVATSTEISLPIFSVSEYLRNASKPGDVFAFSAGDPLAVMVSLSGCQAYISREKFFAHFDGNYQALVQRKMSVLADINSLEDVIKFGAENRVRWYVLSRQDNAALYDGLVSYSNFVVNEIAVFDIYILNGSS